MCSGSFSLISTVPDAPSDLGWSNHPHTTASIWRSGPSGPQSSQALHCAYTTFNNLCIQLFTLLSNQSYENIAMENYDLLSGQKWPEIQLLVLCIFKATFDRQQQNLNFLLFTKSCLTNRQVKISYFMVFLSLLGINILWLRLIQLWLKKSDQCNFSVLLVLQCMLCFRSKWALMFYSVNEDNNHYIIN